MVLWWERGGVSETMPCGGSTIHAVPARMPLWAHVGREMGGKSEAVLCAGGKKRGAPASRPICGQGEGRVSNNAVCKRGKRGISEAKPRPMWVETGFQQAGHMWAGNGRVSGTAPHMGKAR